MASREYSKRLGVLSDEQLQAALDRFGLGRLLSAESAAGGLFGQNVLLTSSEGGFVFRGAPHWDPDGNDDWQFQKEQLFSGIVHEAGAPPVAWPYLLEESREIFGWHWAIAPRLLGDSAEHLFGGNRRAFSDPAFARRAGEALATLHRIPAGAAGAYEREQRRVVPYSEPLHASITGRLRALLAQCCALSPATTLGDIEWVEQLLDAGSKALAMPCEPCIVHLDYSAGNIVGNRTANGFEVTGIVDWMTAEVGHPESDLVRLLHLALEQPMAATAFLAAYAAIKPLAEGWRERFPVFMLIDRLLFWEYGQRNGVWFTPEDTLRSFAEPYVGLDLW